MYNRLLKIPWSTTIQNGQFLNLKLPNLKYYHSNVKNFYNVLKIKPEATQAEVSSFLFENLYLFSEFYFKTIILMYSAIGT